jgi:hypothetical protein
LIAICEATGPSTMRWSVTGVPSAAFVASMRVACAALANVCGTPCATSTSASTSESGSRM